MFDWMSYTFTDGFPAAASHLLSWLISNLFTWLSLCGIVRQQIPVVASQNRIV